MSIPGIPDPARLIVSVLTAERRAADEALSMLVEEFGPIESEIGPLEFDFTSYYEDELGKGIRRWLWVFRDLVERDELANVKCLTNEAEKAYSSGGKRRFNLDPGFLSLENFVLATGKIRAHRIYLGRGIFGDLTLIFRKGSYRPLEWTYPDYASPELIGKLNGLRGIYKCTLEQWKASTGPS